MTKLKLAIVNFSIIPVLTGHGNVVFDAREVANLRAYLIAGGFLHISDNYGLDPFIRKIKGISTDFIELPLNHEIYQTPYQFKNGLPKIHEHEIILH